MSLFIASFEIICGTISPQKIKHVGWVFCWDTYWLYDRYTHWKTGQR